MEENLNGRRNFEIPEELKENLSTDNCWKYIDDMFRSVKEKDADKVAPLNFIFDTEKRIRDRHMYDETIGWTLNI